jgi:hypothetical protein
MHRESAKTYEEKVDMVKIHEHIKRIIDSHQLGMINTSNLKLQMFFQEQISSMVIKLSQSIAALPEKEIIIDRKWPKTWWDAVKEHWFPNWALKHWPVKYESIFIREKIYKAICPHLNVHPIHEHLEWVLLKRKEIEKGQ